MAGANTLGVPFQLLRKAEGQKISVETSSGGNFCGKLDECEENMNMSLSHVKATFLDGTVADMQNVYLKAAKIRYIQLPDMLKDDVLFRARHREGGFGGRGGRRGSFGRGGGNRGGRGRSYSQQHRY